MSLWNPPNRDDQETARPNMAVILGTMTFGENSRITDPEECKRLIEIFKSYGHTRLDTARIYNNGTSEEFLGKIGTQELGMEVATKIWPTVRDSPDDPKAITHKPEDIEATLAKSLSALKLSEFDLYYLHAPDRSSDLSDSITAMADFQKQNKYRRWGISNYKSWEVSYIWHQCLSKNLAPPKVYQGIYNVIHREVEPELIPCLDHYDIAFYAYNPLAGGFFTDTGPKSFDGEVVPGTRFDDSKKQGQQYRNRYWKESYFKARALIATVAEKNNLTLVEIALRWMKHHSKLNRLRGDGIIIGASSEKHLRENLSDLEKGPLPEEVLVACDEAWKIVKGDVEPYWR